MIPFWWECGVCYKKRTFRVENEIWNSNILTGAEITADIEKKAQRLHKEESPECNNTDVKFWMYTR